MSGSRELLDDTLRLLRTAGVTPSIQQARHIKVRWTDSTGRSHCIVLARSPGDVNALHHNRALLRRLLRSAP
jgi:hypothetical protein